MSAFSSSAFSFIPVLGHPGAHRLDEGHELALVVGGAAAADHLALGRLLDRGLEGRAVPQLERVDGLDVVMAIKQEVRAAFATVRHHHRVAGRRALRGVEANGFQILHQPRGGGVAIGLVGGIGRDRRDAQQRHQAVEGGIEIGVDPVKNGGKCHGCLL
jgi:hypothetical protein